MKMFRISPVLFAVFLAVASPAARSQSATAPENSAPPDAPAAAVTPDAGKTVPVPYVRPTEKTRLRNYVFDMIGPYPIIGAALAAGINQGENTPPEWGQGAEAYGHRFGSDFGIAAITTTTRYGLSRAFGEDSIYYRCDCKGFFPRLMHASISTLVARRGDDGHRVFSFPALVSPYVGTMSAVYGWFPGRYNAEDGFRMGNYTLLSTVGNNIALEFIYGGPHTLLARMRHKKPASP